MDRYSIFCTEEQTREAIELGAPIVTGYNRFDNEDFIPLVQEDKMWLYAVIPTAEQMFGWLRTKGFAFNIAEYNDGFDDHVFSRVANSQNKSWYKSGRLSSVKEATLAAIDAALECLTNN